MHQDVEAPPTESHSCCEPVSGAVGEGSQEPHARSSFRVASDQCPAMMTATAIVLDWPDLTIGLIFVKGFRLLGEIESP